MGVDVNCKILLIHVVGVDRQAVRTAYCILAEDNGGDNRPNLSTYKPPAPSYTTTTVPTLCLCIAQSHHSILQYHNRCLSVALHIDMRNTDSALCPISPPIVILTRRTLTIIRKVANRIIQLLLFQFLPAVWGMWTMNQCTVRNSKM